MRWLALGGDRGAGCRESEAIADAAAEAIADTAAPDAAGAETVLEATDGAEEGHALKAAGQLRDRWIARRQRLFDAVAAILGQGEAPGEIRSDISSDVLAVYLLGLLRTRANDLPAEPPPGRSLDLAFDLFWSDARAEAQAPARPVRRG